MPDFKSRLNELYADFQLIVDRAIGAGACVAVRPRRICAFGLGRSGTDRYAINRVWAYEDFTSEPLICPGADAGDPSGWAEVKDDPVYSELLSLTQRAGALLHELWQAGMFLPTFRPDEIRFDDPTQIWLAFLIQSPQTLGYCRANEPCGAYAACSQIKDGVTTLAWIDQYAGVCLAGLGVLKAAIFTQGDAINDPTATGQTSTVLAERYIVFVRFFDNFPDFFPFDRFVLLNDDKIASELEKLSRENPTMWADYETDSILPLYPIASFDTKEGANVARDALQSRSREFRRAAYDMAPSSPSLLSAANMQFSVFEYDDFSPSEKVTIREQIRRLFYPIGQIATRAETLVRECLPELQRILDLSRAGEPGPKSPTATAEMPEHLLDIENDDPKSGDESKGIKIANGRRKRRRQIDRHPKKLTEKQLQASQLYGELKGNFAAVGKSMGISRQAAEKHYRLAAKKLGRSAIPKHKTQSLPKDKRGNDTVEVDPENWTVE